WVLTGSCSGSTFIQTVFGVLRFMSRILKSTLRCLIPTLALMLAPTLASAEDVGKLPASVSSALASARVPASAFSLAVIPLGGQGMSQFVNADQAFNPASTMK